MKAELRALCIQRRNMILSDKHIEKSNQIVEKIMPLLTNKKTIGIYIPIQNEVDITSLLFLYPKVGVPKVKNSQELDFYLITNSTDLEKGYFNILEPTSKIWIDPIDFDCIIVPMVGFDTSCNRIGYGKGYYDRYLKNTKAYTIGVAFDSQKVEGFQVDKHDFTLDCIVTENNVYKKTQV